MTSNPTPDPNPESARALLWRHGLPEDVIDGALCLHAQELAAVQRREAAVWGVDTAAGKRILGAADLIDPTSAAAPAVSSVVGQTTRDRIADVAKPFFMNFSDEEAAKVNAGELADALAAVLPPPADRAAVLREEAALIRAHCPDHLDSNSAEGSWISCHCDVADDMERRADEVRQPDTKTRPARGDAFEAWLKAQRDEYEVRSSPQWHALDEVLDTYRLHADTGTPLDQHACDGPHCDCPPAASSAVPGRSAATGTGEEPPQ